MQIRIRKLITDIIVFIASVLLSYYLIRNGALDLLINKIALINFLTEFIAGGLFTSFLTVPFSLSLIYILSDSVHPLQLALIGGLGASAVDMIIVNLFRNSFFDDFATLEKALKLKKVFHFFHHSHFNHLAPLIGILIIASPFPDEIGLMMLGASKLKTLQLFLLTFAVNAAGIYLISIGAVLI